jgi:hypothetical protein
MSSPWDTQFVHSSEPSNGTGGEAGTFWHKICCNKGGNNMNITGFALEGMFDTDRKRISAYCNDCPGYFVI